MSRQWFVLLCDRQARACPVAEFIDASPPKHQVKILRFLSLLETEGPTLPRPYADTLTDGIHELRIKLSGEQVRLLYFFCHRQFIVLYHAFIKTSRRVPERLIRKVIAYRDELLSRTTEEQLRELVDEDAASPA